MTQQVVAISQASIVPVQTDLTTEFGPLEIIRGFEKMFRVDYTIQANTALVAGEWGVVHDDGTVSRPSATPVVQTFLCIAGTDRFDSAATGNVTLAPNSSIRVRTTRYDPNPTYHVGSPLTVKDLGGGTAYVTLASGSDPVLARVAALGNGTLTYDVLPVA